MTRVVIRDNATGEALLDIDVADRDQGDRLEAFVKETKEVSFTLGLCWGLGVGVAIMMIPIFLMMS